MTTASDQPEQTTAKTDPQTKEEAVKRAYSEANTALRLAHRDEFNTDVAKRVEAYGFEWSPRPTKQESAKAKAKALLEEAGLTLDDLG